MPAQEYDLFYRTQPIVLWRKTGQDQYNETLYGAPVEIVVRWLAKFREVLSPNGTTIATDVSIILGIEDVAPGDLIWEGRLADLPTNLQPTDNVRQVVTFNPTPDIKGRVFRKEATLMRYRSKLPGT